MIEDYEFGRFRFLGKDYSTDAIIYGDRVEAWWRDKGHEVTRKDIDSLMAQEPSTLIFGTGAHGMMNVPDDLRAFIRSTGVQLIVHDTAQAVLEYNRLRAEDADVAIAMHLTC